MKYDDIYRLSEMEQLAKAVLELTQRREIQWSVTDDGDSFLYSTSKAGLLISGSPAPHEGESEYSLRLINSKGDTVAEFDNEVDEGDGLPITTLLSDLWSEARNNALDVETTFKDMRHALGIERDDNWV